MKDHQHSAVCHHAPPARWHAADVVTKNILDAIFFKWDPCPVRCSACSHSPRPSFAAARFLSLPFALTFTSAHHPTAHSQATLSSSDAHLLAPWRRLLQHPRPEVGHNEYRGAQGAAATPRDAAVRVRAMRSRDACMFVLYSVRNSRTVIELDGP